MGMCSSSSKATWGQQPLPVPEEEIPSLPAVGMWRPPQLLHAHVRSSLQRMAQGSAPPMQLLCFKLNHICRGWELW